MSRQLTSNMKPFEFVGKLVVHIGTHKTGSTSIQAYCMDNYESLVQGGCLYPRSGRYNEKGLMVINHHPLIRSMIGESTRTLQSQLDELNDEIASTNPEIIILSSEVLSREYLSAEPFEIIKKLFPLAKVEWVVFLRAQDEVLTSRYAELIKTGKIAWPQGIEMINSPIYLDHRLRLEKLRYAVNNDSIRVISFNAEKKRLLEAFFEACQLKGMPGSTDSYQRNTSLPWGALHVLRITNCLPGLLRRYARGFITLVARKLVKTRASFVVSWGRPLSTHEREAIKKQYHESNLWVEREFTADQPILDAAPEGKH